MKRAISSAFLAATLAAGSAHANLIANGDFETGVFSPWVINGNVVLRGPAGGDFWFGGGSTAQNGRFAVMFNAGNTAPNGTISQTFATVAGEIYEVEYDYGSTASASQSITTSVLGSDGSRLLSSQVAVETNPPQALTTFSFLFTADGNQATLRFTDNPLNPTFNQDGILDNVSVLSLIPEPETYTLMLAGLGLLGLAARRKTRAAPAPRA
jgi:hypothetical protein